MDTASSGRRGRVLIVDDDPLVRRVMRRALEREHDVVEVGDGLEALDVLRAQPRGFDLVLCDVEMPRMTGPELWSALVVELPEVLDAVVFVTGGARTATIRNFIAERGSAVLNKPFDFRLLTELAASRAQSRLAAVG